MMAGVFKKNDLCHERKIMPKSFHLGPDHALGWLHWIDASECVKENFLFVDFDNPGANEIDRTVPGGPLGCMEIKNYSHQKYSPRTLISVYCSSVQSTRHHSTAHAPQKTKPTMMILFPQA